MSPQSDAAQTGQFGPAEYQMINRQFLARIVGYLAFLLPAGLFLLGLGFSCTFDTISHYYYGPLSGGLFVGASSAVALALFAYSGKTRSETLMATLAAASLVVVAFVPAEGVGCEKMDLSARVFVSAEILDEGQSVIIKPFRGDAGSAAAGVPIAAHFKWANGAAGVHTLAAGIFILVLAYFCFVIFTRIDEAHFKPGHPGQLTQEKISRNRKYRQSGWAIVLSMIALVLGLVLSGSLAEMWDKYNGTFVFESIAILAFARSWLLKGRALMYRDLADQNETRVLAMCEGVSDV